MNDIKVECLNENGMSVLCDKSWVGVISQTGLESVIYFYNPSDDSVEPIETFEFFTEIIRDKLSLRLEKDGVVDLEKPNFSTYYGFTSEVLPDYDEYSGKPTETINVKAAIVECFKGGVEPNQIKDLINNSESVVDFIEQGKISEIKSSLKEDKDPYIRYGVNPKSFL